MALRHPGCACATKNQYFSLCKKRRGKEFSMWAGRGFLLLQGNRSCRTRCECRADLRPRAVEFLTTHRQSPTFQLLQNNNISSKNYGTEKSNHAPKQNPHRPTPQGKRNSCKLYFLRPFFGHCARCLGTSRPRNLHCRPRIFAECFVPRGEEAMVFRCRSIVQRGCGIRRVFWGYCFLWIQKENLSTYSGLVPHKVNDQEKGGGHCTKDLR